MISWIHLILGFTLGKRFLFEGKEWWLLFPTTNHLKITQVLREAMRESWILGVQMIRS